MYALMTPGPTEVSQAVLAARSRWAPNPDLDDDFVEFYHQTAHRITRLLGGSAEYETLILSGEGMLGLEACIASLTEPGDRVLVLDNGVFGAGFADLVKLYGGSPVVYNTDYRRPLSPIALGYYLENNHAFKYATLVHCDTPSGMLNDAGGLCAILKRHGILTVVDSVAAMFGETVDVTRGMDFVCGASQKGLSAPVGLSFVTLSPDAKEALNSRRTPVASFYANLQNYLSYYQDRWFPYTMPAHDINGLAAALDLVEADADRIQRHAFLARACRAALERGGLELYPQESPSNMVTVFCVPQGLTDRMILDKLLEDHGILLAGSFGALAGRVIRIGHMGEACTREKVAKTLEALHQVLTQLGAPPAESLVETFLRRT